jgi:putative spermidine/putrescine transport system ATP-binding protein
MVRPETVTVTAAADGTATVASVAFLGPISTVSATLSDGTAVVAQMSSARAQAFSPGARVAVGVEAAPVLVLPPG